MVHNKIGLLTKIECNLPFGRARNMTLREAVGKIGTGWRRVLEKVPDKAWAAVESKHKEDNEAYGGLLPLCPKIDDIFRCFQYFEPVDTKVVILGQDPYHRPGQAIGLCFGVREGTPSPPSLRSIQKEVKDDLGEELKDIELVTWAKQGVLLLNTALTVCAHLPLSHMKVWSPITEHIIKEVNNQCEGVVFLAWGGYASQKLRQIDTDRHHILISSHPSPLSRSRSYRGHSAFLGCRHFTQTNRLLKEQINW